MEKTTTITLSGLLFSLTESAYTLLQRYLDSLSAHFASTEEKAEIMRDIESRIAEKLFSKKAGVILESDITAIIKEMGEANELEDDDEAAPSPDSSEHSRKLYRDMDAALIGGVASGIAAYFDIDALWIRLLFIASIFFGGSGILLYFVLWLIVPEAKNSSQKLEMRGAPVTLGSISRVVKERVEETRESGRIQRLFSGIRRLIVALMRSLGRVLGALISFLSFFAIIALTIALGIVFTNWNAPYNDFPLREVIQPSILIPMLAVGYVAILIPIILVFTLGMRLLLRRSIMPSAIGVGLIGVWALALIVAAILGTQIAGRYYEHVSTNPAYQRETRTLSLPEFNALNVKNALVNLKYGTTTLVQVHGQARNLDTVSATVDNATLTLSTDHKDGMCIFCNRSALEYTVTTPDLKTITLEQGAIKGEDYVDDELTFTMESGVLSGTLSVQSLTLNAQNSSANATLSVATLTLTSRDSYLHIDGTAENATIDISNSSLQAEELVIENAHLSARGSHGEVNVRQTYNVDSLSSSNITNVVGNGPQID